MIFRELPGLSAWQFYCLGKVVWNLFLSTSAYIELFGTDETCVRAGEERPRGAPPMHVDTRKQCLLVPACPTCVSYAGEMVQKAG